MLYIHLEFLSGKTYLNFANIQKVLEDTFNLFLSMDNHGYWLGFSEDNYCEEEVNNFIKNNEYFHREIYFV